MSYRYIRVKNIVDRIVDASHYRKHKDKVKFADANVFVQDWVNRYDPIKRQVKTDSFMSTV